MVQTLARLYDQSQRVCKFYVADTNLAIRIFSERTMFIRYVLSVAKK